MPLGEAAMNDCGGTVWYASATASHKRKGNGRKWDSKPDCLDSP